MANPVLSIGDRPGALLGVRTQWGAGQVRVHCHGASAPVGEADGNNKDLSKSESEYDNNREHAVFQSLCYYLI